MLAIVALVATFAFAGGRGSSKAASPSIVDEHDAADPSATASRPASSTSGTATSTPNAAGLSARANAAIQLVVGDSQSADSYSVAAINAATGASYSTGAASGMWTASAYKLLLLEALVLKRQDSGGLSASERQQATVMIEQSDNEDGYSLFENVGGRPALTTAVARFGMTNTVPGKSDPAFTTTSASDYLILLRNLVAADSPLNAASREYIVNLMMSVNADQRWGVGVVADPGTTFANKNGWLAVDDDNGSGEDDGGLWIVATVGIVTVNGQQVLLAVFSQHQTSMDVGVRLVESLATIAGPAVAP